MGTATYFSPEQAQGQQVDPRSDLYSLGACSTRCSPPGRRSPAIRPVAIAYKHVQEQPAPPSTVNPTMPAAARGDRHEAPGQGPDRPLPVGRGPAGRPAPLPRGPARERRRRRSRGRRGRCGCGHRAGHRRRAGHPDASDRWGPRLHRRGTAEEAHRASTSACSSCCCCWSPASSSSSAATWLVHQQVTVPDMIGRTRSTPPTHCATRASAVTTKTSRTTRAGGRGRSTRTRRATPRLTKGSTVQLTVERRRGQGRGARRGRPHPGGGRRRCSPTPDSCPR